MAQLSSHTVTCKCLFLFFLMFCIKGCIITAQKRLNSLIVKEGLFKDRSGSLCFAKLTPLHHTQKHLPSLVTVLV